jgi:hypothetical protein
MNEIPQKGWYIHKEGKDATVPGTKVYLDGKLVGGIQKLSVEIDAEKLLPILKLELVAFGGLRVDTSFGELECRPEQQPETTVFRSSQSPEEILASMKKPEDEIL